MRPLGPRTRHLYSSTLRRAFGGLPPSAAVPLQVLDTWSESNLGILRAALRRHETEAGRDPGWIKQAVPRKYAVKRVVRIPGEQEAQAYETAAAKLPPGVRVMALLPIVLGLRAAEVCGLRRDAVRAAVRSGELIAVRKGGEEQVIRVAALKSLFEELLATKPARPKAVLARGPVAHRKQAWDVAGEVLSGGGFPGQYQALRRLVQQVGETAGIDGLHPHLLRHAFATRMNRDGAPLFTIQAALNHKHIGTTQRYVHASAADVEKFQRPLPAALSAALGPGTGVQ